MQKNIKIGFIAFLLWLLLWMSGIFTLLYIGHYGSNFASKESFVLLTVLCLITFFLSLIDSLLRKWFKNKLSLSIVILLITISIINIYFTYDRLQNKLTGEYSWGYAFSGLIVFYDTVFIAVPVSFISLIRIVKHFYKNL
jgi:hypothetical protein